MLCAGDAPNISIPNALTSPLLHLLDTFGHTGNYFVYVADVKCSNDPCTAGLELLE